jgi:hypothetical protein
MNIRTNHININTDARCMQINLQHSGVATDNIMNLIQQDHIDIVFVQEPYLIQNKTAGITRTHRTYISDADQSRAVIIIANYGIDTIKRQRQRSPRTEIQEYKDPRSKYVSRHI